MGMATVGANGGARWRGHRLVFRPHSGRNDDVRLVLSR